MYYTRKEEVRLESILRRRLMSRRDCRIATEITCAAGVWCITNMGPQATSLRAFYKQSTNYHNVTAKKIQVMILLIQISIPGTLLTFHPLGTFLVSMS